MPADKPFPFRKPDESQEQAADRISRELQEAGEKDDDATPTGDEGAAERDNPAGHPGTQSDK